MTVDILSETGANTVYFDDTANNAETSRVFNNAGNGAPIVEGAVGLDTQFTGSAVSSCPNRLAPCCASRLYLYPPPFDSVASADSSAGLARGVPGKADTIA
jgi:hypothetical protein